MLSLVAKQVHVSSGTLLTRDRRWQGVRRSGSLSAVSLGRRQFRAGGTAGTVQLLDSLASEAPKHQPQAQAKPAQAQLKPASAASSSRAEKLVTRAAPSGGSSKQADKDYEAKPIEELRKIAQERGIKGVQNLKRKQQLIDALIKNDRWGI